MSSRKPPSNPGDWDDFDIPTWDDSVPSSGTRKSAPSPSQRSSSPSRRTYPDPLYDDYQAQSGSSRTSGGSGAGTAPPSRLSSRVPTRSTRPAQDPYRDPYSGGYDDPYVVEPAYDEPAYASQSRGGAASYDPYGERVSIESDWDEVAVYDDAPAPRRGRSSRQRSRSAKPSVSIARPAIPDSTLAGIVGAALLGLLLMAGVVWWGIGDLSSIVPWHLNASGDVDQWISNTGLWRIPFGVFVTMVLGIIGAAYLWKRDRFAARFFLVSICIAQLIAWVAVVDQLW